MNSALTRPVIGWKTDDVRMTTSILGVDVITPVGTCNIDELGIYVTRMAVVNERTLFVFENGIPSFTMTPVTYKLPCECGQSYIGMTNRTVAKRLQEYERHICLPQPDKSVVAEHALLENHTIQFKQARVIAREKGLHHLARRL